MSRMLYEPSVDNGRGEEDASTTANVANDATRMGFDCQVPQEDRRPRVPSLFAPIVWVHGCGV